MKHLLPSLFQQGVVTVFAYGQTGSGKTYTVASTTQDACNELFAIAPGGSTFYMSFFEIYGGKASDLLNDKKKLAIMEDAKGKIQVQGLEEKPASSAKNMIDIINFGHEQRTTH
jgi:kinesin family protein 2/24